MLKCEKCGKDFWWNRNWKNRDDTPPTLCDKCGNQEKVAKACRDRAAALKVCSFREGATDGHVQPAFEALQEGEYVYVGPVGINAVCPPALAWQTGLFRLFDCRTGATLDEVECTAVQAYARARKYARGAA